MKNQKIKKQDRLNSLEEILEKDPFKTDEDLANIFNVSIQTIRLDRLSLGIPELRERVKQRAEVNYKKLKSIGGKEIVGELIDLNLGSSGISILDPTDNMVFEKTNIVKGHNIFSQAESLAMAIIDANIALTGVANIKYIKPVKKTDKLVAKAELIRVRGNKYFVHVKIYVKQIQVFRGKFILVNIDI